MRAILVSKALGTVPDVFPVPVHEPGAQANESSSSTIFRWASIATSARFRHALNSAPPDETVSTGFVFQVGSLPASRRQRTAAAHRVRTSSVKRGHRSCPGHYLGATAVKQTSDGFHLPSRIQAGPLM